MNKLFSGMAALLLVLSVFAQSPQQVSYQAIIRNAEGKLIQNAPIGMKISILQGSPSGNVVYTETHLVVTNVNGLVSLEIGNGTTSGSFTDIDWSEGPYFLKTETDPSGGAAYNITGISQLLSVPYALYSEKAANVFSGDYNDLTNKPITDGSETRIEAGMNIAVNGNGTIETPYRISTSNTGTNRAIITESQTWTVPPMVTRIKVELWGGAGGGGGAGAYSYSYFLNQGGHGGSGGFAQEEMEVIQNQQFFVTIGSGGTPGTNATYYPGYWYGDTDGGDGGDTWFEGIKAAGGTGGKRGSYDESTVHGNAGTANTGSITGYAANPQGTILDVFQGLPRSYINNRVLTSQPGTGGIITHYSSTINATSGEGGCAIISFFE